MRRALLVAGLAGCGRIGFDDAIADAALPICTTPFGALAPIPGVNTAEQELGPVVSADRLDVIFYGTRTGALGMTDLWQATRANPSVSFGPAVPLANVNTADAEGGPSLTADGLTMYFSSDRPGGLGGNDIWMATRPDRASPFSAPTHLAEVSSAEQDYDPTISPDGLELYITSGRPGGAGAFDIWVASRPDVDSRFGTPINLTELNSPAQENGGWMTADRRVMLFTRGQPPGTQTDVWWASRPTPSARFQPVGLVDALDVNSTAFELGPTGSPNGDTIYVSSSRATSDDLYFATRTCP